MQNKIKNQKSKLDEIVERTREDVEERKRHSGEPSLTRRLQNPDSGQARMTRNGFKDAMTKMEIGIIAEVKFASPTEPFFASHDELFSRVKTYEKVGVDALSIVTEKHFFNGDPKFVSQVKKITKLPILQKDFIIDEYQIYEVAKRGADAILLIARLVDKKTLRHFVELCFAEGLEPVVEINDEKDLEKALATKTNIIAVNARDLDSFNIDVDNACKLIKKIPSKYIRLGFSGVKEKEEVEKYKTAGADGVLVGTSLMKAKNTKEFLLSLRGGTTKQSVKKKIATPPTATQFRAGRNDKRVKVKICGIRTLEAAKTAADAGVDFLGFNFVSTSKRYIDPRKARKIIEILRSTQNDKNSRQIKIVGVFQDENISMVNKIAKDLGLDSVQLHGNEDNAYIKKMKTPVIKSITPDDNPENIQADYFILDRKKRGEGEMVDFKKASLLALRFPIFFAGGLNPENVYRVVAKVHPFAVDVASGVETDGKQDLGKIIRFIHAVRHSGDSERSMEDSRI